MAEIVALISTQGISLVIVAVLLLGVIGGSPRFFKWLAAQWEELKDVFKSYMGKQIETMEELSSANKVLVGTVSSIINKVDAIEDKVEAIDTKVDKIIDKIK